MQIHAMAGHLIRRMNQISTQVFTRHMQSAGADLTPVQFAAMDAIISHPGIDQAGIAAKIAYDRATIGGVIDRLETKGLIERTVSKKDRRARVVHPTTDGLKLYQTILPKVSALQAEILPGLDDEERQMFLVLANKVIAAEEKTG